MKERNWFAVYTKSRYEKKVEIELTEQGYIAYLPLIKTLRQWSDRKKMVEVPLISSYVFVNVTLKESLEIMDIAGVVGYVKFEGKPARIRDSHIETLRKAIEGDMSIEISHEEIKPGQKVRIINGPLKGSEGEYFETKRKHNFIINMSNIGFSLKVEVNAGDVILL